MSGEKRTPIQILQDEMRENRKQLYNVQRQTDQLNENLANARKENATQVTALRVQMDERNKKHESAVRSLKSDLKEMAQEHYQQLSEQRRLVMQEMEDLERRTDQKVENLHNWAKERLEEQRGEYQRITQQQQQQINLIKRDIENINRREDNREERARAYLNDLQILLESAEENLPHERYAPGRLDKIKRQLAAAQRQLAEDVPSAAIATVQSAHFELMDLEEEITRKEVEFDMTYQTVSDTVGGLFSSVRLNRNIQLEDDAAAQEADYWTDGRYQDLEDRVEKIKNHIEQYKHLLSTQELNEYLEELGALSAEQGKLIDEAVERIISSQIRAEMGDIVVDSLGQQGYRIKNNESGYMENDQRGSYMIKLQNVAGTEIVTVISPDEQTYQNILSINTYNEDVMDDASKKRRNDEILKSLKENGLAISGETQCNDLSIEELYDVENLIKKGGKKLPKQVMQKAGMLARPGQSTGTPGSSK